MPNYHGSDLAWQQFRALCIKKCIYFIRKWGVFTVLVSKITLESNSLSRFHDCLPIQGFLPLFTVAMAILSSQQDLGGGSDQDSALRKITLTDYPSPISVAHGDGTKISTELLSIFEQLTEKHGTFKEASTNLTAEILKLGAQDLVYFKFHYIVGGEFTTVAT